ncbi:hypothetical protein PI124_g15216 [Phytophthora idaei]|nr:hypothetical protein PI126_g17669 [Phytophthora idaei]KAG3239860.1 hypothetical protein PI124_g15216 [Phytophthora idaei]
MPTADQLRVGAGLATPDSSPAATKRKTPAWTGKKREANRRLCDYIMATMDSLDALSGRPGNAAIALASPQLEKWWTAMKLEIEAHTINGTWGLVDRPNYPCNILTFVWVLQLYEKGRVDRYKARLAVGGCRQKYGADYLETNSPVVGIESVRLLLILAHLLKLDCYHVDFITAFLNGLLRGVRIFMEQPDYVNDGTDRVCELLKGLYGLKQAARH